jgi:DNA-binding NarL/FixJ family response regulator
MPRFQVHCYREGRTRVSLPEGAEPMEILVVDDHAMFLDGLRFILQGMSPDLRVHSESGLTGARRHLDRVERYDLVLLDMDLGEDDGLVLLRELITRGTLTPVVMVSATDDAGRIQSALDAGAFGFIPKAYGGDRLLHALQQGLEGVPYVAQETRMALQQLRRHREQVLETLTRKQIKVLGLLCAGLSNKDIAERMFLTENTVKSHLLTIFQKLGVRNRTECVLKAQQQRLVDLPGLVDAP